MYSYLCVRSKKKIKMDTSSTIIGLVILAVFILPIILLHSARKKRERKQLELFDQYVSSKGLFLQQRELWNHYAIGMDTEHKQLFYAKQHLDDNREEVVSLSEIAMCEIAREMIRPTANAADDDLVLDRLELNLKFKESGRQSLRLEFYNREESTGLSDELELTEKWRKRINGALLNG